MKTIKWKFKLKNCIICNNIFKPINGKQITCSKICGNKRKLNYNIQYNKDNPEYIAKNVRKSFQRNKKKRNEYQIKYNKNHPEIIKLRNDTREYIRKNKINYNGICLDCGKGCKREIHHITPTITGFILICKNCHYKRHGKENRK